MDGTIHLVRHGEVQNPMGVIYGRLPGFNLSERGIRQAEAAADRLADRDVGLVWSSPLERAQETAVPIAARHGLEIVTDDRLIESHTTLEGIGRNLAALVRSPRLWWSFRNPWRPTWGESFAEIRVRVLAAIRDALAESDGRETIIVSHQTPVLVARQALTGINAPRRLRPPWLGGACTTGSVTTMVLHQGRLISASYHAPGV
jgi:broad specificity phosphatase PhoE